jgi:hypothetical protein
MPRYEERRGPEELFWDEEPPEPETPASGARRTGQLDPLRAGGPSDDEEDSWQQFFHEPVREPYGGAAGAGEHVAYGDRRHAYGRLSPAAREYGQLYGHAERNFAHRRDTYYASAGAAPWWDRELDPEVADGSLGGFGPRDYRRPDQRIEEEVVERLAEASWVDASDIEVEASDGVVTLAGEVEWRREQRAAEMIAAEVTGVVDVVNTLRFRRHGRTAPSS